MKKWLTLLAAPLLLLGRSAQAQSVAGPPTNLTPGSYTEDISARLSPNGSRVVFTAAKGERNASYRYHDVYAMNTDGTPITGTIYQMPLQAVVYFPGFDEWGSFAPDNNSVVLSNTPDYRRDPRSLFKVTVDPFLSTQLTNNGVSGLSDAFPAYNSTGTLIAFVSNRAAGPGQPMQLFAMKPEPEGDNNYPFQLTNWADGEAAMPVGTPDGKMFVLKKISDTVQELFKVDLKDTNNDGEGDNLTQITNFGKWITSPSQPVAGGKIFFQMAGKDNRPHVFSMDANGTNVHQVTGANYAEETPSVAGGKLVLTATDPKNGSWNPDVYLYTLDTTTGNGTVTGTYVNAGGLPQAGTTVNAYDGDTLKGTATTDANGVYTLSLPAGGYTLEFITTTPDSWTQLRSVSVSVGKTTTENAFTTPKAANRPRGTIATIKDGKVDVRWAPASGTPTGYNVYRATSEAGPYTKITATPVAPAAPLRYIDNTPGDLASVFYKVTAVHDAGESAFSEISQAANNLAFNGSFELVDGSGIPVGWEFGQWGGDNTGGTDTSIKADGARSAFIKTGATERGAAFWVTPAAYFQPVMPGVAMVQGLFGKFNDTSTTWPLALEQAPWEAGYGYIPWWYPDSPSRGPELGPWDTNGLTVWDDGVNQGTTNWTWLYNTDGIQEWEFTEGTRFSVIWKNDGATTLGVSTAYADDLTYQVQRFGATGWVMGRILDTKGNVPTGVKVTVGGKTINTDTSDTFIVKDVPTGPQTITVEAPGMAPWTKNIGVYGGYRLQEIVVVPAISNLQISGTVKDQQGNPIAGADVRLVTFAASTIRDNIWPDGAEKDTFTTTTDASGNYKFDSTVTDGVAHSGATAIIAHKNGYVSRNIAKVFGLTGNSTGNDITLTTPFLYLEVLKTNTPPTIDGVYNASEWAGSQVFEIDRGPGGNKPSVKTTGYAKWDNDNVYFAFIAEEPNTNVIHDPNLNDPNLPAGIVQTADNNDEAMWGTDPYWNGDDLIEFRLDQMNGAEIGLGYEWWQFLMNTKDIVTDIVWRRAGAAGGQLWGIGSNSGAVTSVKIDPVGKKWTMEVQVPFTGLSTDGIIGGTPTAGQTEWYMTIGRQRHQPHPVGEPMNTGNAIVRFVTSLTPPVKGDLNGDRQVTAADVAIANRIAAGLEALGSRLSRGDINGDGKVDGIDATRILRKVNGLDTF